MPTKTWERRIDTTSGWIGRAFFFVAVASCSIVALSTIWGWIVNDPIDVDNPARKQINRTELVGNFARQCVEKALTVTADQRASLQTCWANQDQQQPLPKNPGAIISSPGVAAVTLEDDLGYAQQWSVIVSVSERPYLAAPATEQCYRIPVLYSSYGLQATSRLGKSDCAGAGATLPLGYSATLSPKSPVFHTLTGFFDSYLTNSGGLDRYITDKSGLVAVPDYLSDSDAKGRGPRIHKLQSTRAVPDDAMPAGGTTIHVFATVDSVTRQYSPRREDYALSLTVVNGRWMVAGIDYAPQLATGAELTPVVPTPTKGQS